MSRVFLSEIDDGNARTGPRIAHEYGCDTVACQAFPCVRVNRPGEFSIGPHCDAAYGHGCANLNCYLPLTKISQTNSLWLESSPGAEDWHSIEAGYGDIKRFWGGLCTHFTVENETASTRVSLDFRCVPGPLFELQRDQYTDSDGYYFIAERGPPEPEAADGGGGAAAPLRVRGSLGAPSKLVGFPWTDHSMV
jgi:hypothetical protein